MALSKTVTTIHGFVATDAYHCVEAVYLIKKDTISFSLRGYKDASKNISFSDKSFSCNYDISGENPIKQAYEYLKTLPEFSGATDV